jgi:hypothetical protein
MEHDWFGPGACLLLFSSLVELQGLLNKLAVPWQMYAATSWLGIQSFGTDSSNGIE